MTKATHTPGPWFVEVTEKSGLACIRGPMTGDRARASDGTGEVANVDLMADGEQDAVMFPRQRADMLANARLIAAAPALVEALQNMSGLYDTPVERRRKANDPLYAEAIETMRAALDLALNPIKSGGSL